MSFTKVPVEQESLLELLTGMHLDEERSAIVYPVLKQFATAIRLIDEVDTLGLEPELPPRVEKGGR